MFAFASMQIREMFTAVAPGYDRANQILSCGTHHRWRRKAVCCAGAKPGQRVLDCATGTGDLAFAFQKAVGQSGTVIGVDFSRLMIEQGRAKAAKAGQPVRFVVGDVLKLPFPDSSFDIAGIAFGIRNVDDPSAGVREMARVVRPGGKVVVLEFGQPDGALFGRVYRWYSRVIIPRVGGWITGKPAAYAYLNRSAAAFPAGEEFASLMRRTGVFHNVEITPVTRKSAYIYIGEVG